MTQRHYLNLPGGTVEITDRVPRVGWELQERAEEGAYGSGTMDIDDPDMDFDPDGLRSYVVVEDESEATDNVLWAGYTAEQAVGRLVGGGRRPLKRVWSVALTDTNSLWNRRVMVGADNKRKVENDTARMAWLLTTAEANFIDDAASMVSSASPAAMDKVDYTGQYLNQIADDCAQHTGKNWWLQRQETGSGRVNVAWYGKDSLTAYASPLYLTNSMADVARSELRDGTSLVWPISKDATLKYSPDRVYTGVYLRYANGAKAIYRRNPDVNDPDSPLYHVYRDFVADYPNVKTKPKAIARATRLLNDMATQGQIIECSVELPKGKATMLRAGMRVQLRATHWDEYTDWRWVRVLSCTVSPIKRGQAYRLTLELVGPGSAADGPPAPPFEGNAFAALMRSNSDGGVLSFDHSSEQIGLGEWPNAQIQGPLELVESAAPWYAIRALADMTVHIDAAVDWSGVVGDASLTVEIKVNGSTIGSDTESTTGGLHYWAPVFSIDVHDVALSNGDVVTVESSFTGGGWTSFGTNQTFLRVGRGTIGLGDGYYFTGP